MNSLTDASTKRGNSVPRTMFLLPLLTDFSGMLLIFTVSRNLAELGAGLLVMGTVGGAHALISSVSSFVFGRLSDKIGRTKLILPGMMLLFLTSIVCLLSPFGKGLFLSMYWCNAFALGMIHPPTVAWLNKGEKKHRHSRGVSSNLIRFCIAWNIGVLSAQLSGGWLFLLGPNTPLLLSSLLAAADLALLLIMIKRFPDARGYKEKSPLSGTLPGTEDISENTIDFSETALRGELHEEDIQSKTFIQLSWLANLAGAYSMSMILHLFPQLAVSLGVPPNQHGMILAMMRVIIICVYIILHNTRFWQYRYISTLAVQGAAASGLLILYFAQTPLSLYIGVLGLALLIGYDYFSGIYYGNSGSEDDQRGFASGMHEASLGMGIAAGSVSGGIIGAFVGERMPYILAIGVILLLTVFQVRLVLKRRKRSL